MFRGGSLTSECLTSWSTNSASSLPLWVTDRVEEDLWRHYLTDRCTVRRKLMNFLSHAQRGIKNSSHTLIRRRCRSSRRFPPSGLSVPWGRWSPPPISTWMKKRISTPPIRETPPPPLALHGVGGHTAHQGGGWIIHDTRMFRGGGGDLWLSDIMVDQ